MTWEKELKRIEPWLWRDDVVHLILPQAADCSVVIEHSGKVVK